MVFKSDTIRSIAARPPSSTSDWVTPERKADCVLLNTVIKTSTISDSSDTTSKTSTREKAWHKVNTRRPAGPRREPGGWQFRSGGSMLTSIQNVGVRAKTLWLVKIKQSAVNESRGQLPGNRRAKSQSVIA